MTIVTGYDLYPAWKSWWLTARFKERYKHDIPTPGHLQVMACIVEGLGAPWNIPTQWRTVDWYLTAKGATSLNYASDLSSFDFDKLTKLVLAAHMHAVRVTVRPCSPTMLKLRFYPRDPGETATSTRHPTLADLSKAALDRAQDAPQFHLLGSAAATTPARETSSHRDQFASFDGTNGHFAREDMA